MWEKNDKSGDRTIHQEGVQPSGGQPSGGRMLLAGSMVQKERWEWDENKKGNEKSRKTPRAQFQLGLDGHGAVLMWEWLKRLCLREETERQQEQEILSKTSCGSLTLDIWASNVSSNVTSSEGPSQPFITVFIYLFIILSQ